MNPAHPDLHYVYVLGNKQTNRIYIGCTSDLEKRFSEHVQGKVVSTKRYLPLDLIYYEAFNSKDHAYLREKNLKSYGSGWTQLKTRIGWAGMNPAHPHRSLEDAGWAG